MNEVPHNVPGVSDARVPPGRYRGVDGKDYVVMSDGKTYEVVPRYKMVTRNGERVRLAYGGTYRRVGVAKAKEKEHAVETQGRSASHQEGQISEIEKAVARRGQ